MEFTIKDWRFRRVENPINELLFFTEESSLIRVIFDKDNNPQLDYVDGSLPEDIEVEFMKKIRELYSDGFSTLQWLKGKLQILALELNAKSSELKEGSTITVNGKIGKSYKISVNIGDTLQENIAFANECANSLLVFRKYLQVDEVADFPDDLGLIVIKDGTYTITGSDKKTMTLFFDKYIVAKEYKFSAKDSLKESITGIRNDKIDSLFEGDMGKFLPTTSTNHNILP